MTKSRSAKTARARAWRIRFNVSHSTGVGTYDSLPLPTGQHYATTANHRLVSVWHLVKVFLQVAGMHNIPISHVLLHTASIAGAAYHFFYCAVDEPGRLGAVCHRPVGYAYRARVRREVAQHCLGEGRFTNTNRTCDDHEIAYFALGADAVQDGVRCRRWANDGVVKLDGSEAGGAKGLRFWRNIGAIVVLCHLFPLIIQGWRKKMFLDALKGCHDGCHFGHDIQECIGRGGNQVDDGDGGKDHVHVKRLGLAKLRLDRVKNERHGRAKEV